MVQLPVMAASLGVEWLGIRQNGKEGTGKGGFALVFDCHITSSILAARTLCMYREIVSRDFELQVLKAPSLFIS